MIQQSPRLWEKSGAWRRLLLVLLIVIPTFFAVSLMARLLPEKGVLLSEMLMLLVYGILVAWISVGFWTAIFGLWIYIRRYNKFSPLETIKGENLTKPLLGRTALLFPIYNEDVKRTFAGVLTELLSLREAEQEKAFDIFILSDSTNPDNWVEEEAAWYQLCKENNAFGTVFYRHRKHNTQRKSGNIADFCRRWGKKYTYMIVFDADSIMSGKTLIQMVKIMENNPNVGILQTPPSSVNKISLLARAQQFASKLYGPLFSAGLHFWQLGDAQYWGHNAIIRIEPFMKHCQLPILPGKGALSGEILSHDFVEAALMRRAGYTVWLAYDIQGSFEESPSTLIDELVRDRRWCQGNLQHSRLLFMNGLFTTHRALFVNGIMSYSSALLWLIFLLFSTVQAISEVLILPQYFPKSPVLFPTWKTWNLHWAMALLGSTAILLFLPKFFSFFFVLFRGKAKEFGGIIRLFLSMLIEVLISTLLAPIRMINHSFFVITTLLGIKVNWNVQNRGDTGTSWRDAFVFHWWNMLIGILWGSILYLINPGFLLWISPIVVSLIFSIPLSVITSKPRLGLLLKKVKLLYTPEEYAKPHEIAMLHEIEEKPEPYSPLHLDRKAGFLRAVVDPKVLVLHISLLMHHSRFARQHVTSTDIADRILEDSSLKLSRKEKLELLTDPAQLFYLHTNVWELSSEKARIWFGT